MKRRDFLIRSLAGAALTAMGTSCRRVEKCSNYNGAGDLVPSHYTRMFPQLARRSSLRHSRIEEGLECLGKNMRGDDNREHGAPNAGYTYLGQFIDHDLTLDLTPLEHVDSNANCVRNFRTPFLDLDHVYGGGPNLSPFLYRNDREERGKERFLVGKIGEGKPSDEENDLPRNPEGIALVGDPRQDENLIIAQLHVAFLKFHNRVLDDLEQKKLTNVGPCNGTLFEQARRLVVWHYQYVVLNEFLTQVTDNTVLDAVPPRVAAFNRCERERFRIPVEFSAAAFRFGHSMVRDSYNHYNLHEGGVELEELLHQTGSGGGAVPRLGRTWVINWHRFFFVHMEALNEAQPIDTKLALGLQNIRPQTVKLFNAPSRSEPEIPSSQTVLPVRTLWRGARVGLPSGQDIARELRIDNPLSDEEIAHGDHKQILETYGFHRETPLWYYILKEAEVRQKGRKLGQIGSRIVGDVITDALHADPNSYLSVDPSWKPRLDGHPVCKMIHLLHYAHGVPLTDQEANDCLS